MDLETRHLRYIDAVEAEGSITRAAAMLGMSQPSLTAQLRRIEQVVGGRLFDRSRHGVRPTPLGEVLVPHARDVLAALDELNRTVRRFHDGTGVKVGVLTTGLAVALCDAVTAALPDRPVDLTVVERRSAALDALADGELDLVLYVDFPGQEYAVPEGVRVTPVGLEPLFIAVPTGHPVASRAEASLAEMAGTIWLAAPHRDDDLDRHLADRCAAAGIGPIVVHAFDPLVMAQMMRRGDDVAVLVQALGGPLPIPGVVVALRDCPLRVRHLLLWSESGKVDEKTADEVRAGLISASTALARDGCRLPGWPDRNPGWLGSPE
ncbi:LysR family transcriptional regulator [Streptosporangium sp. NPDC051022]|uniref:LysR family transcriptional regulator n=1 Tax=Streptosporangium sp. NPDC051022 TaxID=3155752 RepID=UPI00343C78BC